MKCRQRAFTFLLVTALVSNCQSFAWFSDTSLLHRPWGARWVVVPETGLKEYGVYKFRKNFTLSSAPSSFIIHVSADNRYKLFVNGTLVSLGPARGDFFNWNYETVDIAKQLKPGTNVLAALVWNEGDSRPEAQITYLTSFILQGNSEKEKMVSTNQSWRCAQDSSYSPSQVHVKGYYAAGASEIVNMNKQIKGWTGADFNDNNWKAASEFSPGLPKGVFSYNYSWMLQPSPIPQMEMKEERLQNVRKAEGLQLPASWPAAKSTVTVPAHSHVSVLLDQTHLTNAYPTLQFSKGKDAAITLAYAEALYSRGDDKGNRNEVEGKTFIGKKDSIISDGSIGQEFTTLWWRTYRYMQLNVFTKDDPLVLMICSARLRVILL